MTSRMGRHLSGPWGRAGRRRGALDRTDRTDDPGRPAGPDPEESRAGTGTPQPCARSGVGALRGQPWPSPTASGRRGRGTHRAGASRPTGRIAATSRRSALREPVSSPRRPDQRSTEDHDRRPDRPTRPTPLRGARGRSLGAHHARPGAARPRQPPSTGARSLHRSLRRRELAAARRPGLPQSATARLAAAVVAATAIVPAAEVASAATVTASAVDPLRSGSDGTGVRAVQARPRHPRRRRLRPRDPARRPRLPARPRPRGRRHRRAGHPRRARAGAPGRRRARRRAPAAVDGPRSCPRPRGARAVRPAGARRERRRRLRAREPRRAAQLPGRARPDRWTASPDRRRSPPSG